MDITVGKSRRQLWLLAAQDRGARDAAGRPSFPSLLPPRMFFPGDSSSHGIDM